MPRRLILEPIEIPDIGLYDLYFDKWGFVRKVQHTNDNMRRMATETDMDMSDYEEN